jgi:hypothetical protein
MVHVAHLEYVALPELNRAPQGDDRPRSHDVFRLSNFGPRCSQIRVSVI